MQKDIICVDGDFSSELLDFFVKNGIFIPKRDSIYSIREVVRSSIDTSLVGVLLNEINNSKVLIKHPLLGGVMMEPSWALRRFTHLDGTVITQDEVKELVNKPVNVVISEN